MTVHSLLDLLDTHVARYPLMTWQDVYKLLFQGILGPEHLVATPEAFKARLLAEHAAVPPTTDELLCEPVRPDGRLLRVHLRPFKARGGDLDRLLDGCLTAAKMLWGTRNELAATWAEVAQICRTGRWSHVGDVTAFSAWLAANSYPAVHHSTQYSEAYRPAYRIIGVADRERVLPVPDARSNDRPMLDLSDRALLEQPWHHGRITTTPSRRKETCTSSPTCRSRRV